MPLRKAIIKIITALSTLKVTPAARTAARLRAGLLANERGSWVDLTEPTSSWPNILTKPPNGIMPMRYSVSLGLPLPPTVKVNAPSGGSSSFFPGLVRISGKIRIRMPSSLRWMPNSIGALATTKWPNSCTMMTSPNPSKTIRTLPTTPRCMTANTTIATPMQISKTTRKYLSKKPFDSDIGIPLN